MFGLLLDGIYGSGKSTVTRELKKRLPNIKSDSCIFLSEVFTQRLFAAACADAKSYDANALYKRII